MSGIRFSDDFKKDAVSQPIDLELVAALKGAHGAVEAAVEGIGMSPYLQVLVVFQSGWSIIGCQLIGAAMMRTKAFIGTVAATLVSASFVAAEPKTATDADPTVCTAERHRAQTLVAKDDSLGFLIFGRLYFFGFCVPFDREKARLNLERAAALGRTCAPVLLETDRKFSFGDKELARQALFERCAYSLTVSKDLRLAKWVVAEMLSPAKIPEELNEEIKRLIEIFRSSPQKTFALALRYIAPENADNLRQAAYSWLSRLAVKPSPVETEAQYQLGMLVFEPDGSPVKEKSGGWLHVIAPRGHIPAQRDLGRYYLGRSNEVQDHVRGYAWLLVAKRNGLDVDDLLEAAGKRLGAEKIADADGLSGTLELGPRP